MLFILLQQNKGEIAVIEEEQQTIIDRLGGLITCLPKSDNTHLPVSSCYMDYLIGVSKRVKEEDDDEVEELHVLSKKRKIEKGRFAPPSFPSSSSSIKHTCVLTSINKDVCPVGKRRCTQHHMPSDSLDLDFFIQFYRI
jgi:hypothetical protein